MQCCLCLCCSQCVSKSSFNKIPMIKILNKGKEEHFGLKKVFDYPKQGVIWMLYTSQVILVVTIGQTVSLCKIMHHDNK